MNRGDMYDIRYLIEKEIGMTWNIDWGKIDEHDMYILMT